MPLPTSPAIAATVAGTLALDVARAGRGLTLHVALDAPAHGAARRAA